MTAILPGEPRPCTGVYRVRGHAVAHVAHVLGAGASARKQQGGAPLRGGVAFPAGVRNATPLHRAFGGMGHRPMEAKRNRLEGYPNAQAKPPEAGRFGTEKGAGVPVGCVAEKPEGRSGAARVLKDGCYIDMSIAAPRSGRGLRSPAPLNPASLSAQIRALALFFIARNEGSSMVPDNYACIHRIKYDPRKPNPLPSPFRVLGADGCGNEFC